MENSDKRYEEFLRGQEYRKTWSIAYFNSLNFAVQMVTAQGLAKEGQVVDKAKEMLIMWRDWAIDQHAKYYAENIAIVGMENVSPRVVEGLDKAKAAYEGKS